MALNEFDNMLGGAKPAQANEYDAIIGETQDRGQVVLRQSMAQAAQTTPDQSAKVIELSRKSNLPVEIVHRNYDALAKKYEVDGNDYDAIMRQTPKLAAWLAEGENAAVARDDLARMGSLEWMVTAPTRAWKRGTAQVEFGNLSSASIFRDLSAAEHARMKVLRDQMGDGGDLGAQTWWGKALVGGAQQLPMLFGGLVAGAEKGAPMALTFGAAAGIAGQVGPQVVLPEEVVTVPAAAAIGYYIGSSTGASEFSFKQEAGHAYEEFSKFKDELGKPLDPSVARAAAIAAGGINAGLEVFQLNTLMRTVPGADKLFGAATRTAIQEALRRPTVRSALQEMMLGYGRTLTTETITEVAQRAVTILSGELGKVASGQDIAKRTTQDIIPDLANEAIEAAQAFTYLAAPGHVMRAGQEATKIREAKKQEAFFIALGEGVTESKTFQRMPDKVQQFIAEATKDGPIETVYIPVESWIQYFQEKGLDPKQVASEVLGSTESYDSAVSTGTDLPVKMAAYATRLAPTEHNAFFAQELRLAPDQMNAREAVEFETQLAAEQKAANDAQQQQQQVDQTEQATQQVTSDVTSKLVASGVEKATAEAYAATYGAAFRSIAQRAGVDPKQLYERFGLKIEREGMQQPGETAMNQSDPVAQKYDKMFPRAGAQVDGRAVRGHVPNMSSIEASFTNFDILPGVREVPISAFDQQYVGGVQADTFKLDERTQRLADEITNSGELNPLIVGIDEKGPYIVEGAHRYDALVKSGAKSIPAIVVIDKDAEHVLNQSMPETMNVDGVDRPTMNSNGAPIASTTQAIEAFWRWFGDSKVVDVQGRPLVVYHGTSGDFNEFVDTRRSQPMLYFSVDAGVAGSFAARRDGGNVMPVYLSIKNPEVVRARDWGGKVEPESDGVQITDSGTFIAVNSEQIKSATGNIGTFDPLSGNILEQQQGEAKRGRIRFGNDRQFKIDLLEGADLSTFLHESGHFWLEVLGDVVDDISRADPATLSEQQVKMASDYQTLLNWLGAKDRAGIKVDQHEQFARGIESYVMEGKAPSAELRSVFAKFRAWMLSIYRSLRSLNVTLTPEVRDVMDRMFATDSEIEAAQNEALIAPLFTDAKSAGMTDIEFSAYKGRLETASTRARDELQAKLLRTLTREREQWWKSEREKERKEVETAIHARPEYIALSVLQSDKMPNGDPLPYDLQRVKLDRKALAEQYGEDFWKSLPRGTTAATGIHPNTAAELVGYGSGEELVKALGAVKPMRQTIEQETDARMRAKHGDVLVDGTMIEAARAAVQNDERVKVIEAELRALNKLRRESARAVDAERQAQAGAQADGIRTVSGSVPPLSAVRQMAAGRVAASRVRDLTPGVYLTAARKNGAAAIKAAASADYSTAMALKQRELMNVELFRYATRAIDEVEKSVDYLQSFGEAGKRGRIGKAGQDYLDQIDGFLERYDFARVPLKTLERRKALAAWIAEKERQGETVDLPPEVIVEKRMNWKDMTVEELEGVRDSVKHIEHLSRLKNRLLTAKRNKDLAEVVTEIEESIRANAGGTAKRTKETRLPGDAAMRFVDGWFGSHRKIASIARELDGLKDAGPMWEYVIRPLNEAGDREATMNAEATAALGKLFDVYKGAEMRALYAKTRVDAIGESLTKMARLVVALNWGNADNKQKIMDGYTWNEAQVQAILDTLDERDWKFVQGVWDFIDGYWPQIEAKEKRVKGVAPDKVQRSTVMTKFGEFAGGYYPLEYDDRQSPKSQKDLVKETAEMMMRSGYGVTSTKRGHTNKRVEGVREPIRLDLGVVFEHTTQVIHDLTHHEALIDVNRIMNAKAITSAVIEHYGNATLDQFTDAITDIAAGDVGAQKTVERAVNWVRQGVSIAAMGWNLMTSLLQPLGLSQSIVRIGPKWVGRGLARWLRDASGMENSAKWVNEKSEFMRNRARTQMREMNEIRNQVGVNTGKFSGWIDQAMSTVTLDKVNKQAVVDSYFWMIHKAQQIADLPTWMGAYEKALDSKADEATAIALADQAVLDSQGGGQMKDLAGIQRGGPMLKLWTNFYSYFNVTYNLTAEGIARTKWKSPASIGRLAVDFLMLYTLPASLGFMMRNALTGKDDEDPDTWRKKLIAENLSYLFGSMVLLRELGGAIQGYAGYKGPAGAGFFAAVGNAVKQVGQGEADAAFWRSLNDTAGILFHYPAGQVKRSTEGFVAMQEGRTRNPMALIVGAPKE